VNADGSGNRPLTHGPADKGAPSWSPDGRAIAYSTWEKLSSGVYLVKAS
jgi:Tol biopolymer transport system component